MLTDAIRLILFPALMAFAASSDYMIYASLFGGALTLLLLQFRKLPLPNVLARQEWIQRLHDQAGGVPYGIALAAAALTVYPHTGWMTALGI
jgi:prepilin peptidase CpaA